MLSALTPPYEDRELGELSFKLPLGVWLPNGVRLTDFAVGEYKGQQDLDLGRLEDRYAEHPQGLSKIYQEFLPTIITNVGGYSWQDLAHQFNCSPSQVINNFYIADVIALALSVRLCSYGSELALSGRCPCDEAFKIRGGENTGCHDLNSIVMRIYPYHYTEFPRFQVVVAERELFLEPAKFGQLDDISDGQLPLDTRLLLCCSSPRLSETEYGDLDIEIIDKLQVASKCLHYGPDKGIEQDCPQCGLEWTSYLEYGRDYEQFYLSLLSAPRSHNRPGATEEYLNRVTYFLSKGEQAPRQNALELSPSSREWWVKTLSDDYKKQEQQLKQQQAQSRAKSRKR